LVHPDPGFQDWVWRAKYCLRGLALPHLTYQWFRLLQTPKLGPLTEKHPHILSKLQRPYLNRTLGPANRLRALKNHYRFITHHFPHEMVEQVYAARGLLLASIPLGEIGHFSLRLLYCDALEKEGDLTIQFSVEDYHAPLALLTFSISVNEADRREVFIGGLQGSTAASDKDLIIAVTRAMHGLRPKALVVFALQQLAGAWAVTDIRAVSDAMHVYRHYRKRKKLRARYDEFWLECGGRPAQDGMFDLPTVPGQRDLTTIKANKRQMYRRRYAMLEKLAGKIRSGLTARS
jgi:uncharacterized protein VirK/YbjX